MLQKTHTFSVLTNSIPTKGKLVYEYNPLRNLRLTQNKYEYEGLLYTEDELNSKYNIYCGIIICGKVYRFLNEELFNEILINGKNSGEIVETDGTFKYETFTGSKEDLNLYLINKIKENKKNWKWYKETDELITQPSLYEKGTLTDFVTDQLDFSLEHPVSILPQYSYDGSINLILNDGINTPKLINSRFSATGKNTYEIVDRSGDNDSNIYDEGDQFEVDSSLYKRVLKIPKVEYLGNDSGGNLKVGNYHFYFRLADADGNETDFVAESGLVSVFIGFGSPASVTTGTKNENSHKVIKFFLSNIDTAYSYIKVYYSRYLAEQGKTQYTEYKKIDKNYIISNSGIANINITGFEDDINIEASDINLMYNIVDAAKTQAICQNMLFLGNVHKPEIPYSELQDLSLRFLPFLKQEVYKTNLNQEYAMQSDNQGYFDSKFIYNKTGYWNEELYRLGIVYILPNGELSPVFNIRGAANIQPNLTDSPNFQDNNQIPFYTQIPLYNTEGKRQYISYNDKTFFIESSQKKNSLYENVKGVIRLQSNQDTNIIHGLDIRVDVDTIKELSKYVKGYFFVRQPRIPLILAQGITIGIDQESRLPTIPTAGGILDTIQSSLNYTHVQTEDLNGVNYISEGFLSRYNFEIKKKKSGLFKKILKAVLIGVSVVAIGAAAVFTGGAAVLGAPALAGAVAGGASAAGAISIAASVVGTSVGLSLSTVAIAAGAAGLAAGLGTAIAGTVQEVRYSLSRTHNKLKIDGKNTQVPTGYKIVEKENSRKLTQDFNNRIIIKDPTKNKVQAILCPDYEVDQPYFNQIFTGNKHTIGLTISQGTNGLAGRGANHFSNIGRHFYMPKYYDMNVRNQYVCKVIGIPDGIQCQGIDNILFRSKAGNAEEAASFEFVGTSYENDIESKRICSDLIRGNFGPYLAINDETNVFSPAETVNIYIPNYNSSNLIQYMTIRMEDNSTYSAISDRIDINDLDSFKLTEGTSLVGIKNIGFKHEVYRGDCYICQFTHRLNRNFNDPSAPYNDKIVDENTWKQNFDPSNVEKYYQINTGDLNAIELGMWVTFTIRSSKNLNIRTLDFSNVSETSECGHPRGYYPYFPMSTEGTYKIEESHIYNKGFSKSLSERYNIQIPDIPYIKNWYGTRIMYSDIHINDAFKNGFRTFQGTHYRDYTREYGEIVKLIPLESNLLCVFEHGIALIPVNERALAGQGAGGNVYINTSNVLPENPIIISDMFGSQWADSILKVPGKRGDSIQYVYGVDTVAKKIWQTDGRTLVCISDFKVQEFLNNNITLGERELTPKLGIRNVKTVYNAFKRDVLFTFYDNTYGFEEKVWNLCWNEPLQKFITFYSWVPSDMENINNIPFSFDRNTTKWIAKLGTSHSENSFSDGITLSNIIIDNVINYKAKIPYITKEGIEKLYNYELPIEDRDGFVGILTLSNRALPDSSIFYTIDFSLQKDQLGNYKHFKIMQASQKLTLPKDAMFPDKEIPIYYLKLVSDSKMLMSELYYRNKEGHSYADQDINKIKITDFSNLKLPIFKDITGKRVPLPREEMINPDKIVTLLNIKAQISIIDEHNTATLGEAYYNQKAGYQTGSSLINAGYYESVVAVIPKWNMQFLFTDFWKHGQGGIIDITDNIYPTYWYGKQHPFEFEFIVVDDPSIHKIFTNLEIISNNVKPESFHYEIIGDAFDFAKDKPNIYYRQEALKALWQYNGADISYNKNFVKTILRQQPKSADLIHKYYTRQDTINDIEDYYIHTTYPKGHDYSHLSGGEIVYYPNRQEYRIWNHVKAVDMNELSSEDSRAIIAANCQYLENKWLVSINPILVCYKNEYAKTNQQESLIQKNNSTWAKANNSDQKLPPLPIYNSPIPDQVLEAGRISFPEKGNGEDNALYELYDLSKYNELGGWKPLDLTNWLDSIDIYQYNFGTAQNRKELDVADKFVKIRIRYTGDSLVIIDFLNTIYQISYA